MDNRDPITFLLVCVCVCVCVCEREKERERKKVCMFAWVTVL